MSVARVRARFVSGGQAVVDMAPVIRTGVGGSMPIASTASIACSTRSTLGQPDAQQDFAAGTHKGQVEKLRPAATARTMSMRETTVPKSLAAQRTKAKMLPGAKLTIRRRRSRIFLGDIAEANPLLDFLLEPVQFDSAVKRDAIGCAGGALFMMHLHRHRGIRGRASRAACRRR